MSNQQTELNADVEALGVQLGIINATTTSISAELVALQTANPALDLSSLSTFVTNLTTATSGLVALVPVVAVQAFDPGSFLPLYTLADSTPVAAPWVAVTDVTGAGGATLYTNSNDTANAPPAAASASWVPYTGALTTV